MRLSVIFCSFLSLLSPLWAPRVGEAATIAELLGQARQAQGQVRGLKNGGANEQLQAVQILGPIALGFVGASDLAQAAQTQRATVRDLYDTLSDPLEDIYNGAFARINSMSKAVMDRDGDLEALYETKEWKDAQQVASQSLYFLNWLRYIGSFVSDADKRKKLLQQAADGFSEFAVGQQGSQLKRESLFGRALCEKELRQFDWAVRDFELLLQDTGLPSDMERKVRASLADAKARRTGKGTDQEEENKGTPAPPSADDIARAMLQKAQSLFDKSRKETGEAREKTRWEAIAYLEEVKKKGGTWKDQADAVARTEMTATETALLEEEKSPFPQWKEALEYLHKNEYGQAVPLLKEVVASEDPRAIAHRRDALYFLSVGLFQQKEYRETADRLAEFFSADGTPPRYGADAAYLRFKAAEALYAKAPTEENTKLYLTVTKDFIRRYPNHKSIFEAYFRLGEYEQSRENYLAAVDSYQKVTGDLPFRVRADFATLQSYFALLDAIADKKNVGISEKDLRQRIAPDLPAFWKDVAALEQNPSQAQQIPSKDLQDWRGRVTFLNTVFLGKDMDANAAAIATLLQDFEKKYPEQKDAFDSVARTRLIVLEKTGRFPDLEKNVDSIFAHYKPDQQKEILKGLDQVLPRDIKKLDKANDKDNLLAAKRTLARLYSERLNRGDAFAPEESPDQFKYNLAQLYLDVKDYDKAAQLYQELQQGAYSLASLAGLAQLAAIKGDTNQALNYWDEMLKGTQVGDPLWFRGTYETAQLQAGLGNKDQACKTVSSAFVMIGRAGDQGLKKKIQDLSLQTCKK